MVTGEPIPVEKHSGDRVIGSTVNGNGSFVMRAERVGRGDSAGANCADGGSSPTQSGARFKNSRTWSPLTLCPQLSPWLSSPLWFGQLVGPEPRLAHALVNAVAVLIIACPCALGLATPMSIMVAMGKGAGAGVLFRNAEAIEVLHQVDTLVVDKTGTLTEGKPELVSIMTANSSQKSRAVAPGCES